MGSLVWFALGFLLCWYIKTPERLKMLERTPIFVVLVLIEIVRVIKSKTRKLRDMKNNGWT